MYQPLLPGGSYLFFVSDSVLYEVCLALLVTQTISFLNERTTFDAVLCFEVHVAQSVIFRVVHCGPLVVLSTFISFNHCVLYHSSIQYI
jgi:hypothetical protein